MEGFNADQPAYQRLRAIVAEHTEAVVPWVGAGASVEAGLPTWGTLRHQITEAVRAKFTEFESTDREGNLAQLEKVENLEDPWLSFERLKELAGETTWTTTIREALRPASSVKVPWLYEDLWKLNPAGVLTTNLDRLANRAFYEVHDGEMPHEFNGKNVGRNLHILKSPRRFIVNLHGTDQESSTWVLTRRAIKDLLRQNAYTEFLNTCLTAHTVVFVGLTADDLAVSSQLEYLGNFGDTGTHYWITDRTDAETDRWAEQVGVQVIRYRSRKDDHSALRTLFNDLLGYSPEDVVAPPVVGGGTSVIEALPTPDELEREDAELIRDMLNAAAREILSSDELDKYQRYEDFCTRYDQAIYRAWYTTDKKGENELLGYVLEERVKQGAFGKLYRAHERDNSTPVAVKVLHEGIRTDSAKLESFRRGVRSMQILEEREVEGVVSYLDASEIPAFVVMDWINGPTLSEAVENRQLRSWHSILDVGVQTTKILRLAHRLPERVLHRDVRPPNIMLRDYYATSERDVVVLDFDLSWHKGALEQSIIHGASAHGYWAPEQIQPTPGISTRHGSVDSFGLGMTLFFMAAARDPAPNEHRSRTWQDTVLASCKEVSSPHWHSVPFRFARLIVNATREEQAKRWDLGQIEGELAQLQQAVLDGESVRSSELVAEELAARSNHKYQVQGDGVGVILPLASGAVVTINADEPGSEISVQAKWESAGQFDHKAVGKWLPRARDQIASELANGGWRMKAARASGERLNVRASIATTDVVTDIDGHANTVDTVIDLTRFD